MIGDNDRVARILAATNGGRSIYAKILEQPIPDEGRHHLKNPAYPDTKGSLSVYFKDGRWRHFDHGNEAFSGDCFNFYAQRCDLDIHSQFAQVLDGIEVDYFIDTDQDSSKQSLPPPPKQQIGPRFNERPVQSDYINPLWLAGRQNHPDDFSSWMHDLFEGRTFAYWSQSSTVCSDPLGPNYVLFSYLDLEGNLRSMKRVKYATASDPRFIRTTTLKRDKDVEPRYIHKEHGIDKYSAVLYGLNWLRRDCVTYVVESEKTAELGKVYLPRYNWVASGGANNLREPVLRDIGHLPIVLVPDTNKLRLWSDFAQKWDGLQPPGYEWTYNIQCWDDWHTTTSVGINKGEDIGDLMQCFHHLDFARALGGF